MPIGVQAAPILGALEGGPGLEGTAKPLSTCKPCLPGRIRLERSQFSKAHKTAMQRSRDPEVGHVARHSRKEKNHLSGKKQPQEKPLWKLGPWVTGAEPVL